MSELYKKYKCNFISFEIHTDASERAIADTLSRSIILDMCNVGYVEINGKKFNLNKIRRNRKFQMMEGKQE